MTQASAAGRFPGTAIEMLVSWNAPFRMRDPGKIASKGFKKSCERAECVRPAGADHLDSLFHGADCDWHGLLQTSR